MSQLRITLQRSIIGRPQDQKDTARILGFTRRTNRTVVRPDNPAIRGMINKLSHLVSVAEIEQEHNIQRGS